MPGETTMNVVVAAEVSQLDGAAPTSVSEDLFVEHSSSSSNEGGDIPSTTQRQETNVSSRVVESTQNTTQIENSELSSSVSPPPKSSQSYERAPPPTDVTPDTPGKKVRWITAEMVPPPLVVSRNEVVREEETKMGSLDDHDKGKGSRSPRDSPRDLKSSKNSQASNEPESNAPPSRSGLSTASILIKQHATVETFEDEPLEAFQQSRKKNGKGKRLSPTAFLIFKRAVHKSDQGDLNGDDRVPPPSDFSDPNSKHDAVDVDIVPELSTTTRSTISNDDVEMWGKLDEEYEKALEERDIGYTARYSSVRQSALFSVMFMLAYLILGTTFAFHTTEWELHQALFFSIYTISTVGFGNYDSPSTPSFQIFTIVYIFVGIATLTIMVAQIYQFLALEATRAQHARDKTDVTGQIDSLQINDEGVSGRSSTTRSLSLAEQFQLSDNTPEATFTILFENWFRFWDAAKHFFRDTELGKGLSVLFPFAALILIGAIVVGPIEGWTAVESIYFAVVSLTTVGYGKYVPEKAASIWFCIFWLPFSVVFMSLFLGNIASFYIRLSDNNIRRIERDLRRNLEREKKEAEKGRKRALRGQELTEVVLGSEDALSPTNAPSSKRSSGAKKGTPRVGFDSLPESEDSEETESRYLFGSPDLLNSLGAPQNEKKGHRELVIGKSQHRLNNNGPAMETMKDVIYTVKAKLIEGDDNDVTTQSGLMRKHKLEVPIGYFRKKVMAGAPCPKPSLAVRVIVQERFAQIIATEVAGHQSSVEIEGSTLSVTINSLNVTANKWKVPLRARKAFRAVSLEALYFVGERGLITKGVEVLYALTPIEFHGLFNPLLAAIGDAEAMNGWLASTEVLADVDLPPVSSHYGIS